MAQRTAQVGSLARKQRFAELTLSQDGDYYQIGSVSDLQNLAYYVNGGGDTSGLNFKLMTDINGVDFHIGDTDAHKFKGTFDGNEHKIIVNYGTKTNPNTTNFCALFNYLYCATIKNLTIDGAISTSTKCAASFAVHT